LGNWNIELNLWKLKNKMSDNYKPEGYNSVSPYFIVDGAQKMVDFLKRLFNAQEKRRYDMPDGTIMHVELQIDDSIIMLRDSSKQFPAVTHVMHVYVEDVDKTFDRALRLDVFRSKNQRNVKVIRIEGEHSEILQGIYGRLELRNE
jgi:hypothetical protein